MGPSTKGIKSLVVALTRGPRPRKDQVLTFKGLREGPGGGHDGPRGEGREENRRHRIKVPMRMKPL